MSDCKDACSYCAILREDMNLFKRDQRDTNKIMFGKIDEVKYRLPVWATMLMAFLSGMIGFLAK